MIALVQRVSEASVEIDETIVGAIGPGMLILLAIHVSDTEKELDWLVRKCANLRIFNDSKQKMNLSCQESGGQVLVVSQFTLYGETERGNRPSYVESAPPEMARPLIDLFIHRISDLLRRPVESGRFGANMRVSLVNDGPVTLWLERRAPAAY